MAAVYPDFQTISQLRTPATEGEFYLLNELACKLSSEFEIFFNPFLDGDRPDIIILRKGYGAVIIEVKDWDLSAYRVNTFNRWEVRTGFDNFHSIKSPMSQVFHYKSNLFNLHIPILGIMNVTNNNFYKTINVFVYFHGNTKIKIANFYKYALEELKIKKNNINKNYTNMQYEVYEKEITSIDTKMKKLERDRRMSFTQDIIDQLIRKILNIQPSKIFNDKIYQEFRRRLLPSEWFFQQGIPLSLDERQERLARSCNECIKIRGVAGCGKTSILAKRALNAYQKHGNVLILTFNNTLKKLIRDKLSHINHYSFDDKCDINKIEVSNYHQFFIDQLNNIGIEITVNEYEDGTTYIRKDFFENKDTIRYKTILIDEVQDYEKEWIYIIRDFFLEKDGEMILFGDRAQNIYDRELSREKNSDDIKKESRQLPRLRGFGSTWIELKKSYRNKTSLLTNIFRDFQEKFLLKKYDNLNMFDRKIRQEILSTELLAFASIPFDDLSSLAQHIDRMIRIKGFSPNDTTIVAHRKTVLCELEDFFHAQEKTITTFPTKRELKELENLYSSDKEQKERVIKKLDQLKKYAFQINSGLLKFATVNSFKGMESKTVFYILDRNDTEELIYTAITRARENLIIYNLGNDTFNKFFDQRMESISYL